MKTSLFATALILPFSAGNIAASYASFSSTSLTPSANVTDLATADLNKDGREDIITGLLSQNIEVQLAKSDGSFESPTTYPTNLTQATSAIAAGKLSNDNAIDIVAIDQTGTISVLINNGDGTLKSAATSIITLAPWKIVDVDISDVTNDGSADLILTTSNTADPLNPGGRIITLPVSAAGIPMLGSKQEYSLGRSIPSVLRAEKLNGDQYNDIAVGDSLNGAIYVFAQNSNGNGTLNAVQTFPSGLSSSASLAISDMNNDGKNDILVGSKTSHQFSVLTGTHNADQSKLFAPGQIYALPFMTSRTDSVVAGDFNDDGFPDVAVGSSADMSVSLFINQQNGTFDTDNPQIFSPGFTQSSMSIGNFNNDSRPDLAIASNSANTIQVGINTYKPIISFSSSEVSFPETIVGNSTNQAITVTNTGDAVLKNPVVTLSGEGVSAFHIGDGTCSIKALNPKESCIINLTFSPTAVGTFVASLTVEATGNFNKAVGITGKAQQEPQQPLPNPDRPVIQQPKPTISIPELQTTSLGKKNLQLKISCPSDSEQGCAGKVKLLFRRRVLASATYTVKPKTAATLTLKVNRKLLRRLARKKKTLPVNIVFTASNNETKTIKRQIRVR